MSCSSGPFFRPPDEGAQALRLAREIIRAMPPEINAVVGAVNAPPAPFVAPEHHLAPGYVLLLAGSASGLSTPGSSPGSARASRRCSTWSPRCPT